MSERAFGLTERERRAYAEDGFFVREQVFARREIDAIGAAVERAARRAAVAAAAAFEGLAAPASTPVARCYEIDGNRYCDAAGATIQLEHAPATRTLRVIEPVHRLDPRIDELVDDPRLVDPMRDLLGADEVSLFTDKLNLKRPREGSGFRWHQDSPYWAHCHADPDELPNAMLSIDASSERNGCLRVIPGSHRRGLLPGLVGEGVLGALFTDPACFDERRQLPIALPAGSLLFFSPSLVHGSQPNDSSESRRALIFTYQRGVGRMLQCDAKRVAGR